MSERPILFSGPMVRAILDGPKTQTRRVIKPQPPAGARYSGIHFASYEPASWFFNSPKGPLKVRETHAVGDRLWVRETWAIGVTTGCSWTSEDWPLSRLGNLQGFDRRYAADNPRDFRGPWRPSIHMPKWAARIWLEVTGVRVERVQDISHNDAVAEGAPSNKAGLVIRPDQPPMTERAWFRDLWDSLNAKCGHCWDANPWVTVVEFKRIAP